MARHQRTTRSLLLGATALVGALALSAGSAAAQQREYSFDLPAQPLDVALRTYARTAEQQVIFAGRDVLGRTSAPVNGSYSAEEALQIMLAGSDLTVQRTAEGVLQVARASEGPQSGSAAGGGAEVEALIVTAQKREEDIQDVPIAISAFTQEDLTRSQIAGGPDLVTQIPNFTFTKTNFSSYSIQIRGIGTQAISATTDPAVAVAFNNTPFVHNRFFEQEFYDLQRVEVLRGPQGTLYGRNATAGVVNIISAKPKFVYEAKASADVSNYSSSRIEAMVNVPLVEDKVALRLAGAWTKRDGYAFNQNTGKQIDGRDLWSTRVSLRISPNDRIDANLIWEHFEENDDRLRSGKQLCKKDLVTELRAPGVNGGPDRVVEVTDPLAALPDHGQQGAVSTTVQSAFSQGCKPESLYSPDVYQTVNGLSVPYYFPLGAIGLPIALTDPYLSTVQSRDLRTIESSVEPDYRAKSDIGEFQVSIDLTDKLTLSSETAYNYDFVWSLQDFNRFTSAPGAWAPRTPNGEPVRALQIGVLDEGGVFCDPQLGCSDRLVAVDLATSESTQFSQEIRLASDFDGPFNFSLGANFMRFDTYDKYYVFINSLSLIAAAGPPGAQFPQYVPGQTDNVDFLFNGYFPGNPNGVYPVQAVSYIDPNPIGSLNDEGHNYFLSKNPYKLISYAAFGEAYYKVADNLKVTAGLRWTVDKKEAPRVPTWLLASGTVGYPVAEVIEQEWREPTGRLAIDWKPDLSFTDETLLYASYAHGYKAGGANPPGFVFVYYAAEAETQLARQNSATRPKTFDPEFVDAYEIGAKNTFLDGRATANLAAFYYDYTGYQVSEIVDRSAFNRNFDATVWGVELESDWRPVESLRLGLKMGYQKTRIKDGEQAIDLMDRTAGTPGWSVVRPFPTYASNCILPTELYMPPGGTTAGGYLLWGLGSPNGGGFGGCEYAYLLGLDPGTEAPYGEPPKPQSASTSWAPGTYPGFDPATAPNNGEGFFKQLGGNELPNAPHWTATLTGDYSLPMPNDWLATLHTDIHWQSQSWWRVFNDLTYDKLHPYFTMNVAAIFTNEDAGWNIMAYVKNVTDETAITGAFLFSDDTGLTTNVFLTEPRLYGLRVTKSWSGGPLLGSSGSRHDGLYPFTIELGGQIQRQNAPNEALLPGFTPAFAAPLDVFDDPQNYDLDWGDGREVKVSYRPGPGPWSISAAYHYGEVNGTRKAEAVQYTAPVCGFAGRPTAAFCTSLPPGLNTAFFRNAQSATRPNHGDATITDREDHALVDLAVSRDVTFADLSRSTISVSLRYADLESDTTGVFQGIPDWNIPSGFFINSFNSLRSTHSRYDGLIRAEREFQGGGPIVSWDAAWALLGDGQSGRVNLDWSLGGGVLRGEQKTSISGSEKKTDFSIPSNVLWADQSGTDYRTGVTEPPFASLSRSKSVTVPTASASLGLSYEVDRFKIGAGYRWERYFDAIDGGYTEHKSEDRTIDGPYLKIAVGFGG